MSLKEESAARKAEGPGSNPGRVTVFFETAAAAEWRPMKDTNHDIFGYAWEDIQAMQNGTYVRPKVPRAVGQDYGSDPVGNGMFKMVPSGDIVDAAERTRRLAP